MTALRRRRPAGAGQSLVEFALVLPIFLLLFFAVVDLGRAIFTYNSLTNAARESARLAIVNQDAPSILARGKAQLSIGQVLNTTDFIHYYQSADDGTSDLSTECASPGFGCVAVVSFKTTYRPLTPIIGNILFKNGVTMTATSALTVEYSCPNASRTAAQCPKQP